MASTGVKIRDPLNKITKITVEYSNGLVKELKDDDAINYMKKITDCIFMAYNHSCGQDFDEVWCYRDVRAPLLLITHGDVITKPIRVKSASVRHQFVFKDGIYVDEGPYTPQSPSIITPDDGIRIHGSDSHEFDLVGPIEITIVPSISYMDPFSHLKFSN